MTDKQTIIDGVDVSGCELYRNDNGVFAPDGTAERTELCYLTNDYCGNSPNCCYKQLKRKEKECEELNKELRKNFEEKDTLHLIIDRLLEASGYDTNTASAEDFEDVYEKMRYEKQQLDAYKMEAEEGKEINAELKAKNKELIKDYFTVIQQRNVAEQQLDQLKAENERLQEEREKAKNYNLEYGQLLIKATNKNNKLKQTLTEIKDIAEEYQKEYLVNNGVFLICNQILQKINECEGSDER